MLLHQLLNHVLRFSRRFLRSLDSTARLAFLLDMGQCFWIPYAIILAFARPHLLAGLLLLFTQSQLRVTKLLLV
ncbi:hypothetical protein FGO68_gene6835 [Halteria grandinella]|uniref:Uncharacterized protein n=1 Tax=Halteria grandinella TaxID=5974 RepID=A0A8J8STS3_HALGN|nr:hypothetical protein FGO68_gene6835 [Halteria grandinella]